MDWGISLQCVTNKDGKKRQVIESLGWGHFLHTSTLRQSSEVSENFKSSLDFQVVIKANLYDIIIHLTLC